MEEATYILELLKHSHHNEFLTKIKKQSSPTTFPHDYDKNEEDQGHIHATPSTQNAGIDDSMILQETIKKKCISCIDTEKKQYQIEHELIAERKKNLRYLKIINSKMKKEKELQMAYAQIAQQMKKKMDAANAREVGIQALLQNCQKQSEQLRILRGQVIYMDKILKETQQKLKTAQQRYEALLQARQHKQQNYYNQEVQSQQKILNKFHEKQISQLSQKINQLECQLKLQEQQIKTEKILELKQNKMNSIQDLVLKPVSSRPQLMSRQRTSNKSKQSDQRSMQDARSFSYKKEQYEIQSFKPFNMSKISSIEAKNDHSELNDIIQLNQEPSFNTVSLWASSQFHSIAHSKSFIHSHSLSLIKQKYYIDKNEENDKINQSEYYSIDSDYLQNEISRISDKKISRNLQKIIQISNQIPFFQSQQIEEAINDKQISNQLMQIKRNELLESQRVQKEKDVAFANFGRSVGIFFEKIQESLKNAGKTYKINVQMPRLPHSSKKYSKMDTNTIQQVILSATLVDEATLKFQQQFEIILKLTKKSYEKILNDQKLRLAEMKNRIEQENEEKRHLGKIVQNLQQHKSRLELRISQAQQIPSNSLSSLRETYLRSVIKKKSSLCLYRFKDQQVQCSIFVSNIEEIRTMQMQNYDKIIEFIEYIPRFLNQILKKRHISADFTLDISKDLEPQFQDIILSVINLLKIQISNENQSLTQLRKIRSCIYSQKQILQIQYKSKISNYSFFQGQNNRFSHDNLKERTQKVMALTEKNRLLNQQKQKFQKQILQMKSLQQKMEQQNKYLKQSVVQTKAKSNLGRFESQNHVKKPSVVLQNGSQQGQFVEYQLKVEFNNLYEDKDVQLNKLRQLNEIYEIQLKKYKAQIRKKKKKVLYINN